MHEEVSLYTKHTDFFNEFIVKRKWGSPEYIKITTIILIALALILVSVYFFSYIFFIFPVLIPLIVVLAIFLIKRLDVEYEYIVTNGNLEIARIVNKKRRKVVVNLTTEDILKVEKFDEFNWQKADSLKIIDCTSKTTNSVWCILCIDSNRKIVVLIDGIDNILEGIRKYNRSKFSSGI